jgi:nonribosomal peptide synthetase DhbF
MEGGVTSILTESAQGGEPPRTAPERALAGIFAEVLRVERVGVTDNFFGLGGNSLTAVKLIARVRAEFGVRLPLWVVFQCASVSELAGQVESRLKETATAAS